jgi:hypothetical protein
MKLNIERIDLIADWREIVEQKLLAENFDLTGIDNEKIFIEYYTMENRKVSSKPRIVKKSSVFSCPESLQPGLELFESKVISGDNVVPHQSRFLKRLNFKDSMLFDWNIHHFHLGTVLQSDGFITRTGPLLYAYVNEENIYFLQILDHGNWEKEELIKIIHENWPEAIQHVKLDLGQNFKISYVPNDEERKNFRDANLNSFVKIDEDNIYLGPGYGFSSSGHSIDAVEKYLDNRRQLQNLQDRIILSPENFLLNVFPDLNFITNENLNFKFVFEENIHKLLELNNNFKIGLNK